MIDSTKIQPDCNTVVDIFYELSKKPEKQKQSTKR